MDTVVAEIEQRLEAYEEPIEVAVLGCAVNGIGEASHADFGITGAKNEGLIFAHGKPLRKVPQERLVDELFTEIDRSLKIGRVEVDERNAGTQKRLGRGRRGVSVDFLRLWRRKSPRTPSIAGSRRSPRGSMAWSRGRN